ncbi:tRNA (adenosine(37)-N6)-threonylcarbamoyltransferase complex transferase subunit TsaD [soil metagenome]
MKILAIDTSADDTSAAVVEGRRVLSHVEYSQISLHTKWGGIYPPLAKRAHQERIDWVIEKTIKNAKMGMGDLDAFAVTYGPGLAIALEVGILKVIELAKKYEKPIVAVNHMEGHLYSSFVQNSRGNPKRDFEFPYIGLLISGGHTELILFKDHLQYEILGQTLDDAAGESLDKAARMLGFGYPGGPVIERLAEEVQNADEYKFPRPMKRPGNLDFSFSGLKTAFLYFTQKMEETERLAKLSYLASSFQEAVFQSVVSKAQIAVKQTGVNRIVVGGGVSVNVRLRGLLRSMLAKHDGNVYFPPYKYLNFDNAAMIGVAASFRAERGMFIKDPSELDRKPRLSLLQSTI